MSLMSDLVKKRQAISFTSTVLKSCEIPAIEPAIALNAPWDNSAEFAKWS